MPLTTRSHGLPGWVLAAGANWHERPQHADPPPKDKGNAMVPHIDAVQQDTPLLERAGGWRG